MNRSEKLRATAIAKYGSWEAFIEKRYKNPKALEDHKKASVAGGKASTNRPFKDIEKAKEAYKKGLGKRRKALDK